MRSSVKWLNNKIVIIDQTLLPADLVELELSSVEEVFSAIVKLQVRGAPAIGICAAYGVVLGLATSNKTFIELKNYLASSRPTAVNLFWALNAMELKHNSLINGISKVEILESLLTEAKRIHQDDADKCVAMANFAQQFIPQNAKIITHCNTGYLATGGIGTALGAIYKAAELGKNPHVFVDETRPLLQGSRLTAWELNDANISATLITDNMAAYVMATNKIDLIIVGADRITQNGDTANKIGTYGLACLAKFHNIPFYVVAPSSTFDLKMATGKEIHIEERHSDEIRQIKGQLISPKTMPTYNPAFDVTPNELISAIICEKGFAKANYQETLKNLLKEI